MTIQTLRYIVSVAEIGSITEAAKRLHISQPSLSAALKEAEREVGFQIFTRSRSGIALTKEGVEFLGYARQVIQEMSLLEDRFILNQPEKPRFCVSTQHYTFTANAFVEMVQKFGRERFEFILNETQTHQILEDVKNRFCDLGILYRILCGAAPLCRFRLRSGYLSSQCITGDEVYGSCLHPLACDPYCHQSSRGPGRAGIGL